MTDKNIEKLEKMDEFFNSRADNYELVHLGHTDGGRKGKEIISKYIPINAKSLLDLGCGTGLELEYIFEKFPEINVTGIDMSQKMLDVIQKKFIDKNISLIKDNFLNVDLGQEKFDVAISVMAMHHFNYEEKYKLYSNIFKSLKSEGSYIECDYIVKTQDEEDFYYSELQKIKKEQSLSDMLYHYDIPWTLENQINILKKVGFKDVKKVWEVKNSVTLVAKK